MEKVSSTILLCKYLHDKLANILDDICSLYSSQSLIIMMVIWAESYLVGLNRKSEIMLPKESPSRGSYVFQSQIFDGFGF